MFHHRSAIQNIPDFIGALNGMEPQVAESHSETLSLEFDAARAGAALACAYSNSAEFGAALIAARRAAGVYGSKRHRRQMIPTAAGIAADFSSWPF
jgi:hypothetical protein